MSYRAGKMNGRQRDPEKMTVELNRKILLIDENGQSPVLTFLRQEGYDVVTCASARKAWGLVYPLRPRVIIVHLPNPDRKDLAVLQECRALADGVPVLLAASFPGLDPVSAELKELVAAFINVPLKPNAVEEALQEAGRSVNARERQRLRGKE